METVIIVIHLMVIVALVAVVLLQRSEGGALGMGGGDQFMTMRGQGNVLTRATTILAAIFFATSLAMTFLTRLNAPPTSVLDTTPAAQTAPVAPAGGIPAADTGNGRQRHPRPAQQVHQRSAGHGDAEERRARYDHRAGGARRHYDAIGSGRHHAIGSGRHHAVGSGRQPGSGLVAVAKMTTHKLSPARTLNRRGRHLFVQRARVLDFAN